jgi:hypothetical protein
VHVCVDLSNQNDGGTWTEILTSKWFGSNDPSTGRILDGRWANMSIPVVNDQFYQEHGVDKDQVWFPFTAEEQAWYNEADGKQFSTSNVCL